MAALAGVSSGDVVVAIDGHAVRDPTELRAALHALDTHATIQTTRGRATVPVQRRTMLAGTAYEQITSNGVALRTLIERRVGARATAVFLQGIALSSIEDAAPVDALVHALSDVDTLRVEKRGVGDSEGDVPDFQEEVADFRAALPSSRLVLIGHSVGGMIAPLLYDERVAAIVVMGTSAERWLTCLDASARRQAELAGLDGDAAVQRQRQQIEADRAERSRAFHEQLDAIDLRAAWSRLDCPVLVLHGEHDWVVSEAESRAIVELAPRARFAQVGGLDHAMTRHRGLAESRSAFGRGAVDASVGDAIATFLREIQPI